MKGGGGISLRGGVFSITAYIKAIYNDFGARSTFYTLLNYRFVNSKLIRQNTQKITIKIVHNSRFTPAKFL